MYKGFIGGTIYFESTLPVSLQNCWIWLGIGEEGCAS